jgi:hypothetical protein
VLHVTRRAEVAPHDDSNPKQGTHRRGSAP